MNIVINTINFWIALVLTILYDLLLYTQVANKYKGQAHGFLIGLICVIVSSILLLFSKSFTLLNLFYETIILLSLTQTFYWVGNTFSIFNIINDLYDKTIALIFKKKTQ
jgi:hypothetical protein